MSARSLSKCVWLSVVASATKRPIQVMLSPPRRFLGYEESKRLRFLRYGQFMEGPPKNWHRSKFPNWNYSAELRAFGPRLKEHFPDISTLQRAFVDPSYLSLHPSEQVESEDGTPLSDNSSQSAHGKDLLDEVLRNYLSRAFPLLPSSGQRAVRAFLLRDSLLHHVASCVGIQDMLLAPNYPFERHQVVGAFYALLATVDSSSGRKAVDRFVYDFLITTALTSVDTLEVWDTSPDPGKVLDDLLSKMGRPPAESRIVHSSGAGSHLPVHHVAIFTDREFLSEGVGASVEAAEMDGCRAGIKALTETWWPTRPPLEPN